jgi:predicted CoA-binding protein
MKTNLVESREDLKALFGRTKTIAVVGLSEKPERDSHSISAYLQEQGFKIVGVNPTAKTILGEPTYASLTAIPEPVRRTIDLVVVFRKAEDAPAVLAEAAALGLRSAWLPPGSSSAAALQVAGELGLTLVADKCLRVVHSAIR